MRSSVKISLAGARNLRVSLFIKITAMIALSTLTVVAANLAFGYRTTNHLGMLNLEQNAEASVNSFAFRVANAIRFQDSASIQAFATDMREAQNGELLVVVVTNTEGAILSTEGSAPQAQLDQLAQLAAAAEEIQMNLRDDATLTVAVPIFSGSNGDNHVGAVATVWSTQEALTRAHSNDWQIYSTAAAILVVMMLISVFAVRRTIAQPMERLGLSLADIARGEYHQPLPELGRGDEIGDFARHIGDLREGLRIAHEEELARERDREMQMRVVSALRDGLTALSNQDLTSSIMTPFDPQYEALRTDYNATVASLHETVVNVISSVGEMRQGADEMAGSADNLSQRTETQAATLEQTAAAIQQINTRVTETATNARKAEEIARGAQQKAQVSEPIVREAIEAMALLEKTSSQIAQIITLIDDISFQTNLLALNAGVEAARAGESGRGFAVVATEVRALAQRSSDAAREIKELVTGSTEQVNHGVDLVRRSGAVLSEFASEVDDIAGLMSVVAQAADDQAHSVTEINVGVSQLDSVTQQNAAMVQETTAAIHVLRQQSLDLADLLRKFQLDSGPRSRAGDQMIPVPRRAVA